MNVTIQKLYGLWHLIVGSCQIRTPFLETQDRAVVVAYARRVYPGAKIFERGFFSSVRFTACTRADVTSYLRDWRYRRNRRFWERSGLWCGRPNRGTS